MYLRHEKTSCSLRISFSYFFLTDFLFLYFSLNLLQVPDRNTIGDVPLEWYKNEDHIGYTKDGLKINKQAKRDQLDTFLSRTDDPNEW